MKKILLSASIASLFFIAIPSVQAISNNYDSHHYRNHYRESTTFKNRDQKEHNNDESTISVRRHHSVNRNSGHCH